MIYLPPEIRPETASGALGAVIDRITAGAVRRGLVFVQALLSPDEAATARVLLASGYKYLAELVYMDAVVASARPDGKGVPGVRFTTYAQERRPLFREALQLSYVDSCDCPGLANLRTMDEILDGHAAAGTFEPDGWWVAEDDAGPAGVLLMAPVSGASACEIVYLGVTPRLRGKGVSAALMKRGFAFARQHGLSTVSLAVDSINAPARHLYERWGFLPVARRRAWINILRPHVS